MECKFSKQEIQNYSID